MDYTRTSVDCLDMPGIPRGRCRRTLCGPSPSGEGQGEGTRWGTQSSVALGPTPSSRSCSCFALRSARSRNIPEMAPPDLEKLATKPLGRLADVVLPQDLGNRDPRLPLLQNADDLPLGES